MLTCKCVFVIEEVSPVSLLWVETFPLVLSRSLSQRGLPDMTEMILSVFCHLPEERGFYGCNNVNRPFTAADLHVHIHLHTHGTWHIKLLNTLPSRRGGGRIYNHFEWDVKETAKTGTSMQPPKPPSNSREWKNWEQSHFSPLPLRRGSLGDREEEEEEEEEEVVLNVYLVTVKHKRIEDERCRVLLCCCCNLPLVGIRENAVCQHDRLAGS